MFHACCQPMKMQDRLHTAALVDSEKHGTSRCGSKAPIGPRVEGTVLEACLLPVMGFFIHIPHEGRTFCPKRILETDIEMTAGAKIWNPGPGDSKVCSALERQCRGLHSQADRALSRDIMGSSRSAFLIHLKAQS